MQLCAGSILSGDHRPSYQRQQALSQDEGIFGLFGHVRPKAVSRIAPVPQHIPAEREVFLVYYPRLVTRCRLAWRRAQRAVYFHTVAPPRDGKTSNALCAFLQLFDTRCCLISLESVSKHKLH